MSDVFSKKKRSAVMAAIRSKDTKPELVVRSLLRRMGSRFRVHVAELPGKPDIVIPQLQTIIQIKGCFWHGHYCLRGRMPKANRPYWGPKIAGNIVRDRRNAARLRRMGWRVKTLWECRIRNSSAEELHSSLQKLLGSNPSVAPENLDSVSRALRAMRIRGSRGAGVRLFRA